MQNFHWLFGFAMMVLLIAGFFSGGRPLRFLVALPRRVRLRFGRRRPMAGLYELHRPGWPTSVLYIDGHNVYYRQKQADERVVYVYVGQWRAVAV